MKFWIAGKPVSQEYKKFITSMIENAGLEKAVKMFGYITDAEKFSMLERAWILVHPSIREGWGLNVIEANGMGTPAVGYNVTGLRDSIQDGLTGLLTTKNTPEFLAKSISSLLADKKRYQICVKNALKWADRFNWNSAGEKSWYLIKEIYAKTK